MGVFSGVGTLVRDRASSHEQSDNESSQRFSQFDNKAVPTAKLAKLLSHTNMHVLQDDAT